MSEGRPAPAPPPLSFALTAQEARIAASRVGLRTFLSGRSLRHVAQLAAFALFILFVSILAAAGLIGRRPAEAALVGGAILFMAFRLAGHWRLGRARAKSLAAANALLSGGEAIVSVDEAALRIESSGKVRRLPFAECEEAEDAGGILYLWPRAGEPAFIPARAFSSERAAREFLEYLCARIGRGRV